MASERTVRGEEGTAGGQVASRLGELLGDCVHCGFCLPACPTYQLWGEEMDSPRGRIHIAGQLLAGAPAPGAATMHVDRCLSCMACVSACPSGVRYGEIIEETRVLVEGTGKRPLRERLLREAVFALFPYPSRLRAARAVLAAAQATGVRRALRRPAVAEHLPAQVRAMERLAPPLKRQKSIPRLIPARGERRGTVGLLAGCVQSVFFPEVNWATARVLAAEGFDVAVPAGQGCCGALSLHAGRKAQAARLARANVDVFGSAGVDLVVTNAAGCGSAMKECARLFASDPRYEEAAGWLASRTRDLSELLIEAGPRAERRPLNARVAFHDACHLGHAQGVRVQPRELLRQVPGLEVCEIGDDSCCGSAGVYNILQPEAANELGERKAAAIAKTGAEVVVSTNPGCLMQIRASFESAGRSVRTAHLAEILDESIGSIAGEASA